MITAHVLVAYTIVAAVSNVVYREWHPIAEFHSLYSSKENVSSLNRCHDAAKELNLKIDSYRCIQTQGGDVNGR